jgi:hypothetical protein
MEYTARCTRGEESHEIDRIQIHPPHPRGALATLYFPGLTREQIEALPPEMYRAGLGGRLPQGTVDAWLIARQREREREVERQANQAIERAVAEWRKAKLSATPLPDELDRFFEPRQT